MLQFGRHTNLEWFMLWTENNSTPISPPYWSQDIRRDAYWWGENSLGLLSLFHRRIQDDSLFLIINYNLDRSEILEKFDFHNFISHVSWEVPGQLFGVSHHSTSYQQHSVIPRLSSTPAQQHSRGKWRPCLPIIQTFFELEIIVVDELIMYTSVLVDSLFVRSDY